MIYIYAAIVAAILAAGGWLGYRFEEAKVIKAEQIAKDATARAHSYAEARDREVVKEVIVTKYVDKIVKVQGAMRDAVKEIPTELWCEVSPVGESILPIAWRLHHDRFAATATSAYATPNLADAATDPLEPVTPADALRGVAANYEICSLNALQVISLQDYITSQLLKAGK